MRQASEEALDRLSEYRKAERQAYDTADLRMVEHFAEGFILTSNGVPTVVGRDAARELFRNIWAQNQARFVEVHDDVVVEAGEYLVSNGRFVLELKPKRGGEAFFDRGRFQAILKRGADGKYKLWREATMDTGESDSAAE